MLDELRARILSGALGPGTPLRQDELAAALGVSRVPLREALRILEAEGHVTYAAHRGYRVAELDLDDMAEVYQLRSAIEDDLARRSSIATDAEHLGTVRAAHAHLAALESAADPDPAALARANRAFHWAILRPGPRADRLLTILWDASEAHRARWFAQRDNIARGARDHAEVLARLEAGDARGVVQVLSRHRDHALAAVRADLRSR